MEEQMIYQLIPKIAGEIGPIGKDSYNETQHFRYRGIDAIMNALSPLLTKYGVFIVPEVLEQTREDRVNAKGKTVIYSICKMRFTFFAPDGSGVRAVTVGEGMDLGDKATNKAMAIAFKYALFQVFCIPTKEMQDADAESLMTDPDEVISSVKARALYQMLTEMGVNIEALLIPYGVARVEDLTEAQHASIFGKIEKWRAKNGQK
jgi:hypothetical protein